MSLPDSNSTLDSLQTTSRRRLSGATFPVLKSAVVAIVCGIIISAQTFVAEAQETGSDAKNAPAFEMMKQFRKGVNFGNFLEVPPNQNWGDNSAKEWDFKTIKNEGFDHIRIPIGWHHYNGAGPEFEIQETFFKRVEQQLDWAEEYELAVLINVHHFNEFVESPQENREELMRIWEQVAERFSDRPLTLAYEILNEPHGASNAEVMNDVYAEAIRRIRAIDEKRLIMIGPDEWNSPRGLAGLKVPDDPRVAVTVHCYDPFLFTHQGASWTGDMDKVRGVVFPGPGKKELPIDEALPSWVASQIREYNQAVENGEAQEPGFVPSLKTAAEWGKKNSRPIYVGEFGAIALADKESRANFYGEFAKTAEELELGWCLWDWKAGFYYWDREKDAPAEGMHEALFDR